MDPIIHTEGRHDSLYNMCQIKHLGTDRCGDRETDTATKSTTIDAHQQTNVISLKGSHTLETLKWV